MQILKMDTQDTCQLSKRLAFRERLGKINRRIWIGNEVIEVKLY